MPPSDVGLGVSQGLSRRLTLLQFQFVQTGAQHLPRHIAVLVLRTTGLTGHDRIGRNVGQTHGRVRLVDVLTARARSAIGVGAHIRRIDIDLDRIVHDRRHPNGGEAGVALGRRVIGTDADQPVHARFRLQPAIGVRSLDQDSGRLDPRLLALFVGLDRDLIAVGLGPARVHAQQHASPVVGLGSASAGVHFQIGVVAVGFAGQQSFKLGAGGAILDAAQLFSGLLKGGFVALLVSHLRQHDAVFQIGF